MEERRSLERVAGPADTDAAMVMGNSTRAWDRYYDLRFQQRGAAAAVSAMAPWRSNLLGHQSVDTIVGTGLELDVSEL